LYCVSFDLLITCFGIFKFFLYHLVSVQNR
jgi:hypothetical protein